jgi:hypothetical protein
MLEGEYPLFIVLSQCLPGVLMWRKKSRLTENKKGPEQTLDLSHREANGAIFHDPATEILSGRFP